MEGLKYVVLDEFEVVPESSQCMSKTAVVWSSALQQSVNRTSRKY